MRRTLICVTVAAALLPSPAGASCAFPDERGDATVWSEVLAGGQYDPPVPAPALDVVSASVSAGSRTTSFAVRVADLANLAVDAPTGWMHRWTVETDRRVVMVMAWSAPASSGVQVFAGPSSSDRKRVARYYSGPVVDVAADTVRFSVPSHVLGIRAGTTSGSYVSTERDVIAEVDGEALGLAFPADWAVDGIRPWGRC